MDPASSYFVFLFFLGVCYFRSEYTWMANLVLYTYLHNFSTIDLACIGNCQRDCQCVCVCDRRSDFQIAHGERCVAQAIPMVRADETMNTTEEEG